MDPHSGKIDCQKIKHGSHESEINNGRENISIIESQENIFLGSVLSPLLWKFTEATSFLNHEKK